VAATQRYLDDANAQLSSALTRANAARLEAETLEAAAISINQQTTDAARKKSDAIIAAAEAEARSVATQSQQHLELQIANAKAELDRIKSERESVEVYLRNLRNVLQGAGGNQSPLA
jgi:F0F1-type ATP synthase membrane subunit b/b'